MVVKDLVIPVKPKSDFLVETVDFHDFQQDIKCIRSEFLYYSKIRNCYFIYFYSKGTCL